MATEPWIFMFALMNHYALSDIFMGLGVLLTLQIMVDWTSLLEYFFPWFSRTTHKKGSTVCVAAN